jgi:hypothetical protein
MNKTMLTEIKEYIEKSPEVQTLINWWELYGGHRIKLEEQFQKNIFKNGVKNVGNFSKLARNLKIKRVNRKTISNCSELKSKPTIKLLIELLDLLSIPLEEATSKILQISNLKNPNLPFDLNTPEGADIRAAFLSDGHIPKQPIKSLTYCAYERELHESLINSCKKVFGEFNANINKGNKSLQTRFPSVIGMALEISGVPRGNKQLTKCYVPKDIMCSSEKVKSAYLRRVFDDEGDVCLEIGGKRAVRITRSSIFKENTLINGELLLLKSLGIIANLYNERTYISKKNITTFKRRIQIARRATLNIFNDKINFSLMIKQEKLSKVINSYRKCLINNT